MKKVGISLGWNCNGAIHGVEVGIRGKKDGYLTCPFDEMVTNLSGIIKCLDEDFKYFCDDNCLKIIKCTSELEHLQHVKNEELLHNTYYNFIFNHESPGHANLYKTQNWSGGINHYIDNNYKEFKIRYNKRITNFLNYINDPNNYIIFILHGYNDTCESIIELKSVLNSKYPNLKYELYFLPIYYDKNIIVHHYNLLNVSNNNLEKDLYT
jgi:hypothetical protein